MTRIVTMMKTARCLATHASNPVGVLSGVGAGPGPGGVGPGGVGVGGNGGSHAPSLCDISSGRIGAPS